MSRFEQQTTINASPNQVFDYVSDMTKHGEWASQELNVMSASEGQTGVGSKFMSTAKQFGTQRERQTVTEYEPGKRFAFEATGALGLARHIFDLESADGGTKLTKSVELVKPKFLAKVMSFKINSDAPKALAEDVRRIKAKLES